MLATPSTAPLSPDNGSTHSAARKLCWSYRRDDEVVECQLGLTSDHCSYELRIQPPWNPVGATIELFDDAISAFQRHATIERILISEGWSLDRFEPH
jgi:hypothetical protein